LQEEEPTIKIIKEKIKDIEIHGYRLLNSKEEPLKDFLFVYLPKGFLTESPNPNTTFNELKENVKLKLKKMKLMKIMSTND